MFSACGRPLARMCELDGTDTFYALKAMISTSRLIWDHLIQLMVSVPANFKAFRGLTEEQGKGGT